MTAKFKVAISTFSFESCKKVEGYNADFNVDDSNNNEEELTGFKKIRVFWNRGFVFLQERTSVLIIPKIVHTVGFLTD